ncbi:hypothetical protein BGW36DRAFT_89951 [Talaromyces proteolyticus]|uniref:t-SNARE coiled-coil homology domain-containing protein n=1 Tax=Talaromyces proteolyticus TaxID=1131652 RepID=A0AAD4Q035_9EURO|nr:uncharacterized protein BGW36DRAFT_89951 [Talaromyces proteolyticus]KAH8703668.1 hypothetical protein BGW36DRAFT_89951 [Talaromyces proteolyticus]
MTDLTPSIHKLLQEKQPVSTPAPPTEKTVNEFLKEAYRINSHIQSLLHYLQSIRQSYLSTSSSSHKHQPPLTNKPKPLTDADRDSIDSSTALLLRDLSSSITNLQSAESLRQETESRLLRKKYGQPGGALWRWAGGGGDDGDNNAGKSDAQIAAEDTARSIRTVRESILWFLRRELEEAAEVQRGMVEKRIERVREKEKSVLYKVRQQQQQQQQQKQIHPQQREYGADQQPSLRPDSRADPALSAEEAAAIETQLTPEQLQLFAEENDSMLKHYEDTLSKVQNAEKSLLEISSLQQTLVGHLSTQEEFIGQLVTDASSTSENVGQGNKQLKKATERRSPAQMVFWGTVGLCTWLIVWDAVF